MRSNIKTIIRTIVIMTVACLAWMLACNQIVTIKAKENHYSNIDSIIQIGNVRWRVNMKKSEVVLFTSVVPDAPQMKQVIQYLNDIFGKPYENEEDGFDIKWSSSTKPNGILGGNSTLVYLRRVHSEKGGTMLIFH